MDDPQIEDLKNTIQRQQAVIKDTNRMVHKLRRNIWWGRLWGIAWWVIVFVVSGAAYYYYAQPYVDRLEQYYANFQSGAQQTQSYEQQIAQWFSQFVPSQASTTQK